MFTVNVKQQHNNNNNGFPVQGQYLVTFTLTKVTQKQKKTWLLSNCFYCFQSKVQLCILVSFVFKLSMGLVVGWPGAGWEHQ